MVFDRSNVTFNGASNDSGEIRLKGGSGFQVSAQNLAINSLTVEQGSMFESTFQGDATINLTGNLNTYGLVNLADGATGDALNVQGDLTGQGQISLDIDSNTNTFDQVTVQGSAADANVSLVLNNIGTGETQVQYTLVDVNDANGTVSDSFFLAGADSVNASSRRFRFLGAYGYQLDRAANGDFVLSSASSTGDRFLNPIVPTYAALPQQLLQLGTISGTLNRAASTGNGGSETVSRNILDSLDRAERGTAATWFDITGDYSRYQSDSTQSDITTRSTTFRAGVDVPLMDAANGTLIGNAELRYVDASTSVSAELGGGSLDTTGYGVRLGALWLTNSSFYVDGQFQYTRFDTDLTSGSSLTSSGTGDASFASLEIGKVFDIGHNLSLIPQAQLVVGSIDAPDLSPSDGSVSGTQSDGSVFAGRVGAYLEKSLASGSSIYGLANLYSEFDNSTSVTVNGENFSTAPGSGSA